MEHNRRKCKDVYDRTPNLFTKQEWDRLLSVSCNVAKSKAPESLGVLNQNIGQYLSTTGQYEMPVVVRAISCLAPKDIVALYHRQTDAMLRALFLIFIQKTKSLRAHGHSHVSLLVKLLAIQ